LVCSCAFLRPFFPSEQERLEPFSEAPPCAFMCVCVCVSAWFLFLSPVCVCVSACFLFLSPVCVCVRVCSSSSERAVSWLTGSDYSPVYTHSALRQGQEGAPPNSAQPQATKLVAASRRGAAHACA